MATTPDRPRRSDKTGAAQAGADRSPHRTRVRRRRHSRTAAHTSLETVASAFWLLTNGPSPLSLDGVAVGHGLPRRSIPLPELRAILLHPATGRTTRDAAWRHIVRNARAGAAAWVVGAAGVALPALRRMARDLADGYAGDPDDLDAAVLAGFLDALHHIDEQRPGVITRLRWAAYRAALTARYTRDGITPAPSSPPESQPPPCPWGHPDLVLLDAVAKGVLSPLQAELIGRSRLEDLTLKDAAAELGLGYEAACKARQRGEARLVAAITSGDVERRLSAPGRRSGLSHRGAHHPKPAGVRGRSTGSDGTPDSDRSRTEGGAFCSPARQPSHRRSGHRRSRHGRRDTSGGGTP